MKRIKLILSGFFILSLVFWGINCSSPSGQGDKEKAGGGEGKQMGEKVSKEVVGPADAGDEGTTVQEKGVPEKDNNKTEKMPKDSNGGGGGGDIKISFDPKSGSQIDVKDVCIKVLFSSAPSKSGWYVSLRAKGDQSDTPVLMTFEQDTEAKVCAIPVLKQGTEYTLKVKVKEKAGTKTFTGQATYTTKEPYANDKPADAGLTVSLKISKIVSPPGLAALIQGRGDLPPILLNLHHRDSGNQGTLLFVGGLGTTPSGTKPFTGKDVVNTKQPVSLALAGSFKGRAFYVGPTVFVLAVAGYTVELKNFSLSGVFTKDGKNLEDLRLTGMIDPTVIEKQFGLQGVCLLVECIKDENGNDAILVGGQLESFVNPLPFSIFITDPFFLKTDVDPNPTIKFFTNEEFDDKSFSATFYTCKGSSDPRQPCSKSKGATISKASVKANFNLNSAKKLGTIKPDKALDGATWYKLELSGKSKKGESFKTFVIFKTK